MKHSPRTIHACALFGLCPDGARAHAAPMHIDDTAAKIDRFLQPGEVALLTGPSGGGKSTLLRAVADRCEHPIRVDVPFPRARRDAAAIELFRSPVSLALRHLASAGLAEATVLALPARALSQGQQARLRVALAMERAVRRSRSAQPPTLLIDEFASGLDRPTARSLARSLARWTSRHRMRALCASAHDDLLEWLRPAVLIIQPLHTPAEIARSPFAGAMPCD